jgi:hypothetical protein
MTNEEKFWSAIKDVLPLLNEMKNNSRAFCSYIANRLHIPYDIAEGLANPRSCSSYANVLLFSHFRSLLPKDLNIFAIERGFSAHDESILYLLAIARLKEKESYPSKGFIVDEVEDER